jgi:hypothetical protein
LSRGLLSVIGKISLPMPSESVWSELSQVLPHSLRPIPAGFASLIVAGFPALFAEFEGKHFTLLWRGSRDGFGVRVFHRRCDDRAPILVLIQDKEGNIFGGFAVVAWESRAILASAQADPSQKSFLFSLKNPHKSPARQFALKTERRNSALHWSSLCGPSFGDGWSQPDLLISDNCHANAKSSTCAFGDSYANDTGLDGKTFFTGSPYFTVKEIEVFEIAD